MEQQPQVTGAPLPPTRALADHPTFRVEPID